MRKLLLLTFFIVNLSVFGQDTISVQTFTYDSISTRRAMFDFPDELQGQRFEKVLLYYNLKCSPLTPWDSYNCGEWDYLTNTTIFNHTGVYDSIEVQGPEFLVNGEDVPTVAYTTNPYYHYYQNYQYFINYSSQVDNDYAIGSGTVTTMNPFGTANDRQHTQLLWTANELLAAGVTAGDIAKLRFDVATLGSSLNNLTIKIKHTSSTTVTGYEVGGFSTVYHLNTTLSGSGIQTINLTNPFYYNGTDNLLIDISYHNAGAGVNTILNATNTIDNSVVTTSENLGLLNIDAGNHVEVDLDDYDFQGQVTIAFWANGDATYLPANTSVIEGLDSINQRMLNIHFPWSNSRMYWDAGAGSGYDRIDKAATANEISNNWNHWAFTKQQSTGEMKIYKNGVLWHSGNGLTRTIGTVNKFRIGTSGNGSFDYAGKIDEFQIWNAELPAATIANWMNQKITTAHPNYNNLVLYYDFDNSQHIIDKSVNNRNGMTTTPGMVVPS
ncbi:MAG: LamG domain-containing protein, partial [Putridiphycobacter sp.]|nr:LamG domain-containing protein [Putridiphycobacter sp.]